MAQQHQIEGTEYKTRLIEFANQLALKRPDLNLLRDHPRAEYPVLTESLECLLKERDAQRKLVLPNLAAFNNDAIGIFSDYSGENYGNSWPLRCWLSIQLRQRVKRQDEVIHDDTAWHRRRSVTIHLFGMGQIPGIPEEIS